MEDELSQLQRHIQTIADFVRCDLCLDAKRSATQTLPCCGSPLCQACLSGYQKKASASAVKEKPVIKCPVCQEKVRLEEIGQDERRVQCDKLLEELLTAIQEDSGLLITLRQKQRDKHKEVALAIGLRMEKERSRLADERSQRAEERASQVQESGASADDSSRDPLSTSAKDTDEDPYEYVASQRPLSPPSKKRGATNAGQQAEPGTAARRKRTKTAKMADLKGKKKKGGGQALNSLLADSAASTLQAKKKPSPSSETIEEFPTDKEEPIATAKEEPIATAKTPARRKSSARATAAKTRLAKTTPAKTTPAKTTPAKTPRRSSAMTPKKEEAVEAGPGKSLKGALASGRKRTPIPLKVTFHHTPIVMSGKSPEGEGEKEQEDESATTKKKKPRRMRTLVDPDHPHRYTGICPRRVAEELTQKEIDELREEDRLLASFSNPVPFRWKLGPFSSSSSSAGDEPQSAEEALFGKLPRTYERKRKSAGPVLTSSASSSKAEAALKEPEATPRGYRARRSAPLLPLFVEKPAGGGAKETPPPEAAPKRGTKRKTTEELQAEEEQTESPRKRLRRSKSTSGEEEEKAKADEQSKSLAVSGETPTANDDAAAAPASKASVASSSEDEESDGAQKDGGGAGRPRRSAQAKRKLPLYLERMAEILCGQLGSKTKHCNQDTVNSFLEVVHSMDPSLHSLLSRSPVSPSPSDVDRSLMPPPPLRSKSRLPPSTVRSLTSTSSPATSSIGSVLYAANSPLVQAFPSLAHKKPSSSPASASTSSKLTQTVPPSVFTTFTQTDLFPPYVGPKKYFSSVETQTDAMDVEEKENNEEDEDELMFSGRSGTEASKKAIELFTRQHRPGSSTSMDSFMSAVSAVPPSPNSPSFTRGRRERQSLLSPPPKETEETPEKRRLLESSPSTIGDGESTLKKREAEEEVRATRASSRRKSRRLEFRDKAANDKFSAFQAVVESNKDVYSSEARSEEDSADESNTSKTKKLKRIRTLDNEELDETDPDFFGCSQPNSVVDLTSQNSKTSSLDEPFPIDTALKHFRNQRPSKAVEVLSQESVASGIIPSTPPSKAESLVQQEPIVQEPANQVASTYTVAKPGQQENQESDDWFISSPPDPCASPKKSSPAATRKSSRISSKKIQPDSISEMDTNLLEPNETDLAGKPVVTPGIEEPLSESLLTVTPHAPKAATSPFRSAPAPPAAVRDPVSELLSTISTTGAAGSDAMLPAQPIISAISALMAEVSQLRKDVQEQRAHATRTPEKASSTTKAAPATPSVGAQGNHLVASTSNFLSVGAAPPVTSTPSPPQLIPSQEQTDRRAPLRTPPLPVLEDNSQPRRGGVSSPSLILGTEQGNSQAQGESEGRFDTSILSPQGTVSNKGEGEDGGEVPAADRSFESLFNDEDDEAREADPGIVPVETRKKRQIVIVPTLLTKKQMGVIEKLMVPKFGVRVSKNLDEETTHVVIGLGSDGSVKPTLKYMQGICYRCYMVDFKWVMDCLASEKLLNESPYIAEEKSHAGGAHRCVDSTVPLPFKGDEICLRVEGTEDYKRSCETLVVLCGGLFRSKPEDFRGTSRIIVVTNEHEDNPELESLASQHRATLIGWHWFWTSIIEYKRKPLVAPSSEECSEGT